jgi:transposase-like protein
MEGIKCKNCGSEKNIKNGKKGEKQRYKCQKCGYNFVEGDGRTSEKIVALKALVVLLYSLSKGSYNMLGKIFGRNRSLIYRWVKEAGLKFGEPEIDGEVKEIEFDEMWHYIGKKNGSCGWSRRLIVARGEPSPGCSVVVMLQRSDDCMTK